MESLSVRILTSVVSFTLVVVLVLFGWPTMLPALLVVTFLAVLELVKETLLDVSQAESFSPIYVRLHESTAE